MGPSKSQSCVVRALQWWNVDSTNGGSTTRTLNTEQLQLYHKKDITTIKLWDIFAAHSPGDMDLRSESEEDSEHDTGNEQLIAMWTMVSRRWQDELDS